MQSPISQTTNGSPPKRSHHANPAREVRVRRIARWDKAYYAYEEPDEPCPTLAQLRRAFSRARRSEADKAALAGMLRLAEQYHGRHVYDDDSPDFYRMKGLRHFLSGDPVLAKHYKTLMRYKNLGLPARRKRLPKRRMRSQRTPLRQE